MDKFQKLARKNLKRQAVARPRHFQKERTNELSWHQQYAYWLFVTFPQCARRPWESEGCPTRRDDRQQQYRRKDWRWHLGYMRARRHGEGDSFPLD